MVASQSELNLGLKLLPHSYSALLKSFADQTDHSQKLEEFLARLEEERLKIDVFKRELPLCMQLLTNAVETSRQQLQACRVKNQQPAPILEEFIPLKEKSSPEHSDKTSNAVVSDKANWMTSAQLWIQPSDGTKLQRSSITANKKEIEDNGYGDGYYEGETGDGISCSKRENSAASMEDRHQGKVMGGRHREETMTTTSAAPPPPPPPPPVNTNQSHRKARRCWSPELHRRFVNALQMLGGSQVATPKQIRELMKVDGLTNDEVKSHLQKYRLHTRRPGPNPQPSGAPPPPQLVVLGGIWVPSEYTSAAAAVHESYATAPPPSVAPPQEFYSHNYHQLHLYNNVSPPVHSSPESDLRGVGGRSESTEDGNTCWKGESRGRKLGLAALRDDGNESNGSGITLKF